MRNYGQQNPGVGVDIREKSLGGVPLLEVENDIDHGTAMAFDLAVNKALENQSRFFLDLTRCSYFDSGGMAVMFATARRLRPRGWLGIIGASADVYRLFQIVGLTVDPAVRVFSDINEARDAVSSETR